MAIDLQGAVTKNFMPRDANMDPMAPLVGIDPNTGDFVPLKLFDNGDGTWSIDTTASVVFTPGDIQIGSVELQDGDPAVIAPAQLRVKVVASSLTPAGTGALVVVDRGSSDSFYEDQVGTAIGVAYTNLGPFGCTSTSITVINDSADTLEYSFDGASVHGRLGPFEATTMDRRAQPTIHLRTSNAAVSNYRVWSW